MPLLAHHLADGVAETRHCGNMQIDIEVDVALIVVENFLECENPGIVDEHFGVFPYLATAVHHHFGGIGGGEILVHNVTSYFRGKLLDFDFHRLECLGLVAHQQKVVAFLCQLARKFRSDSR